MVENMAKKVATENNTNISYRYERKFLNYNSSQRATVILIKTNPYGFYEEYPERIVNSIYYDSICYKYYKHNILGLENRRKVRVRWYGDLRTNYSRAILEQKIKEGFLGYKIRTKLELKDPNQVYNLNNERGLLEGNTNNIIISSIKNLYPSLIVSYRRKYFRSFDSKFRLTIDDNIKYLNDIYDYNFRLDSKIVIELKYSSVYDNHASKVSQHFPFRLSKHSKYVSGMLCVVSSVSRKA